MSKLATKTRMQALLDLGQSVWLDYLRRGMLESGELQRLIDDGLRGMTSNPTIFEHAIGGSTDYDEQLAQVAGSRQSDREIFDLLAVEDVRHAADTFRPVYDHSEGADGFVSLEVSPALARDTAGTIAEARRLWEAVGRPNVMVKVPATREGWPAIERLLTAGINVNITLLFSLEHYRQVAEAHLRALEALRDAQRPLDRVASVASFFVSRVDTEVDRRLSATSGLRGTVAIANARLAYAWFRELLDGQRWRALAAAGAKPQRLLWASTGTKDPAYSDVLYVDSLIGADTINTLPPQTLQRFEDHGTVRRTLPGDVTEARRVMERLRAEGVAFDDVTRVLEEEGIEKFAHSFETLLGVIATKRKALARPEPPLPRPSAHLRAFDQQVVVRLADLERSRVPKRIWGRDPTVWKPDPKTPEITDRLGWLTVGEMMAQQVKTLAAFGDEIRREFGRVVLCGMGGSSLAPEVLWRTFGRRQGYPTLTVLDSTDPRAVRAAVADGELAGTLFLISSKSGTTQETDCLYRHFWERTEQRGAQFVAITDPDTPLARLALERRFRRAFLNPRDIGGRYSALSYFGLVPAALIGIEVGALLHRAHRAAEAAAPLVPAAQNPAAWLGATLGEAALAGRNKATLVLSPGIGSFGLWVEQLIAESTGKEGKGIVPIAEEPLGPPEVYGRDRIFLALALAGETDEATEARLGALAMAGHPVVRLALEDPYDLGQEFFRWEFATAVVGAILGINAFDQPNVAESKQNTKDVLARRQPPAPAATSTELDRFLAGIRPGDYLALMAYLPPTRENDRRLAVVRQNLRDRLKVATTVGYGPRFLHSTGQLHKGGPPVGHFLQITERAEPDVSIPGESYTFGELEAAQAEGDLRALRGRGRPAIRIDGLSLLER